MKLSSKVKLILIGLVIFVSVSCKKPQELSPIPEIKFNDFVSMQDSAVITIDFTDGDGDIGLSDDDVNPPYDFNFYLEYFEWNGTAWEPGINALGDTIVFQYRVPVLTPTGRNKALEGEIEVTIEPIYYNPASPNSDTIRYRVKLLDRNLNESNILDTPPIYNGVVQL